LATVQDDEFTRQRKMGCWNTAISFFTGVIIEFYEAKYQQQQLQRLTKQAAALRLQLVPLTPHVS
jgi:hypothetical protein